MREINVSESFQKTGETLSERTIAHLEEISGGKDPRLKEYFANVCRGSNAAIQYFLESNNLQTKTYDGPNPLIVIDEGYFGMVENENDLEILEREVCFNVYDPSIKGNKTVLIQRSVGPAIPFYYGRSFFTGDDMPSDFRQYEYKKIRSGMDRYLDTRHLVEFMVRSRVNPNIHVRKDEVGFFQGGVNQFTDRILARLKRIENLREMGLTVDPYKMLMKVDQKNAFFWTAMVMELDVYRLLFGGELKEHSRGEITVLFNRIINSEGGDLCDAIKWLRFELP